MKYSFVKLKAKYCLCDNGISDELSVTFYMSHTCKLNFTLIVKAIKLVASIDCVCVFGCLSVQFRECFKDIWQNSVRMLCSVSGLKRRLDLNLNALKTQIYDLKRENFVLRRDLFMQKFNRIRFSSSFGV